MNFKTKLNEAYRAGYREGLNKRALHESYPGVAPMDIPINMQNVNALNSVAAEFNDLVAQGVSVEFALLSAGTPNGTVVMSGWAIPLSFFYVGGNPDFYPLDLVLEQMGEGQTLGSMGIFYSDADAIQRGVSYQDPMAPPAAVKPGVNTLKKSLSPFERFKATPPKPPSHDMGGASPKMP